MRRNVNQPTGTPRFPTVTVEQTGTFLHSSSSSGDTGELLLEEGRDNTPW